MQSKDLSGQLIGHYQVKKQIGYGGMATVFLAEDIHLGREVALKVFSPRPGETQDFLRRFAREARVLAQLDHAQILPVYEYGEQSDMAYLVTPYISGGTLKDLIKERKVFPASEATERIAQILPALQYAHDRNLIHRDIKPGNLLLKGDGSLILADFGLVKVVEEDGTNKLETMGQSTQGIAGTPEYMAPEQIEGQPTPASDIYSFGIILYEMVTGTRPFTGDSLLSILLKHVHEKPRPPRALNPYISPQLEAAILRALEKDPHRRFANPTDFQQALLQTNAPGVARAGNPISTPGFMPSGNSTLVEIGESQTPANQMPAPVFPLATTTIAQTANYGLQGMNSLPVASQPNTNLTPVPQQPMVLPNHPPTSGDLYPTQPVQPWTPPPASQPSFTIPQTKKRTPIVVLLLLLLLIAGAVSTLFLTPVGANLFGKKIAYQGSPTTTTQQTGTQTSQPYGSTPTVGTAQQSLPATQTSCPSNARAAVMTTLTLGHDSTIVYIVNTGTASSPTSGAIKLYNTTTQIATVLEIDNQAIVNEAQISLDGEWVLLATTIAGQSELRLVRMDGKEQQTLFCAPGGSSIMHSQWSLNQKYIIFDELTQNVPTVYLLNLQSGSLNVEVPAQNNVGLIPRTWLDNTHVLMVASGLMTDSSPQNIYILDTAQGGNQSISNIPDVFNSSSYPTCWDFDSSYDGKNLFIAECTPGNPGNSTIIKELVNGNTPGGLLTSNTLAINTVRIINQNNDLLILAADIGLGGLNGDPQYDGLYLLPANSGTPQRLTSTNAGEYSSLNAFSQYTWSNVSRNGSMYALETMKSGANEYMLSYGNLSGGTPITFADQASDNLALAIVGWTTS